MRKKEDQNLTRMQKRSMVRDMSSLLRKLEGQESKENLTETEIFQLNEELMKIVEWVDKFKDVGNMLRSKNPMRIKEGVSLLSNQINQLNN